jgi:HEPN domain-containing protein
MLTRSDNGLRARRTESSAPNTLKANAEELLILMKVAFSRSLYYQVDHMGHMAAELVFKAVYAKNNQGEHPWGHELPEICIYEYLPGRSLFWDIRAHRLVNFHYIRIKSAWDMQDRYLRRTIKREDAAKSKVAYREVVKWIITNYL